MGNAMTLHYELTVIRTNMYYVRSTCSVLEQGDQIQPPQQPCEDHLQVKRPRPKNEMAYPRMRLNWNQVS